MEIFHILGERWFIVLRGTSSGMSLTKRKSDTEVYREEVLSPLRKYALTKESGNELWQMQNVCGSCSCVCILNKISNTL